MAPLPLALPLCILPPGSDSPRLVCYCEPESSRDGDRGGFNLYVTDAAELWSTSFSPDSLATLKARFGLSGTEDISSRFKAACQQQAVTVSSPEAALRLQALTFSLAERVCNLEKQLAGRLQKKPPASPRKSTQPAGPHLFLPAELDHQRGSAGLGVRKRCPGESLINPGFKSKKPAGGVDFDDT